MARWEESWAAHAAPVLCDDPALARWWQRVGWGFALGVGVVLVVLGLGVEAVLGLGLAKAR